MGRKKLLNAEPVNDITDTLLGISDTENTSPTANGDSSIQNTSVAELEKSEAPIPLPYEPEWHDYVMKHFKDDELIDGNPTTDGLRRVAQQLIGPITQSLSFVINSPNKDDYFSATVEHQIEFLVDIDNNERIVKTYQDVADCSPCNTEVKYGRYPTSTAATRAEGRVLRKALGLKRVLAAEEIADLPEIDLTNLNSQQVAIINNMCRRLNINTNELFNAIVKKNGLKSYKEISHTLAIEVIRQLNDYQQGKKEVPANLVGFEGNFNF